MIRKKGSAPARKKNSVNDRYREIVENINEGLWEIDADGYTIYVNSRMADMLGCTVEEMAGRHLFSFMDMVRIRQALKMRDSLKKGRGEQFDFELLRKDKSRFFVRAGAVCLKDEKGDFRSYLSVVTDITLRKQAEEELKKSRKNFSIAFHSSPAATTLSTLKDGRYIDVNKSWLDMLGFEREETIGSTIDQLDIWADKDQRARMIGKLIKEGSFRDEPVRLRSKGGALLDILWSAHIIEIDGEEVMLSLCYYITELRKAEDALREAGSYVRSLIEASIDPLVVISLEGKVTDVNRAAEQITGFSRGHLIGTNFSDYVTEPEVAEEQFQKALAAGFLKNYPLQIRHRNGTVREALCNVSTYRNASGEVIGMLGAARDITEQKKSEEALRDRDRELSIKAGDLQELNSALKVLLKHREEDRKELEAKVVMNIRKLIMPYLEKLQKSCSKPDQKAYLEIMESHLKDIISPFLYALTSRDLGLTPREIQVVTMIREDKSTKEISNALNISTRAVEFHRNSVRKKLQIANKKVNLKSYLSVLG